MPADLKYLKRRRKNGRALGTWTFQVAVPRALQERLGVRLIERSLGTSSLREAQQRRWDALAEARERRLRPDYARSPEANGLPLEKLIEKFAAGPDDAGLAAATLNKHVTALSGLFKWAMRTGVLPEDHRNPFEGQHRRPAPPSKAGWLPYEVEELAKLVERPEPRPKRHTWASARPWIVLVALFSGMRLGEICSLDADDIKEEDRVPFFDITAAKSEAGIRRVPVHPTLLALGFLDYVRHVKRGPLFLGVRPGDPDKKRAYTFSKQFGAWRRRQGVDRPRVGFHSFRKNVVAALERARMHQSEVAQIVGHERGFTFSVYSPLGLDLQDLRVVVEKIAYPKLDIDALTVPSEQPRTPARGALARCPSTANNAEINDGISTS